MWFFASMPAVPPHSAPVLRTHIACWLWRKGHRRKRWAFADYSDAAEPQAILLPGLSESAAAAALGALGQAGASATVFALAAVPTGAGASLGLAGMAGMAVSH